MLMVNGNGDIEAKLLEDQEEDVENMYSKIEGGKRGVSEEKDCKVVAELERKDEKTGWRLRSWLTGDSKRESKVIESGLESLLFGRSSLVLLFCVVCVFFSFEEKVMEKRGISS